MENLIYLTALPEWYGNLENQRKNGSSYPIFPLTSSKGRIVPGVPLYFLKLEVTKALIIVKSIGLIPIKIPEKFRLNLILMDL